MSAHPADYRLRDSARPAGEQPDFLICRQIYHTKREPICIHWSSWNNI